MPWNRVTIVGVGMMKFGEHFEMSYEAMIEEVYLRALASVDRGIDPKEIKAGWIATCRGLIHGQEALAGATLAGNIGLAGIPVTRIENGCATGSDAFRNACLGVASGVYDVALVLGCEKMRDKSTTEGLLSRAMQGHPIINRGETAPALFSLYATRHMHEFGTTKEQMALVAVKNHRNAVLDPYAHFRNEISVEDVLKSPVVAWPLNVLDCCPQTDGAAAIIICSENIATRYSKKPVYVAGFGCGTDYIEFYEKENFTGFAAAQKASQEAYRMAGITPKDIDVAEIHDCFTITEIISYEDLGFCEKGEGGKLVERGDTEREGRIPVNPSGGLLSKGHPLGATGIAQLIELYWHLREEAGERQVKINKGFALQHNIGGMGLANSVVNILTIPHAH